MRSFFLFFCSLYYSFLLGQVQEVKMSTYFPPTFSKDENVLIMNAKIRALSKVYPVTLSSKQKETTLEKNVNNEYEFRSNYSSEIISNVNGVWVKDITSPEISYNNKNKKRSITVKVHGYVTKKPNRTEARDLLLEQLSSDNLNEDIQIHSIEYYPNDFIVSTVLLDNSKYKSQSKMNRVANILAKRQVMSYFQGSKIEDVFIYKTNENGRLEISKEDENTYNAIKESSSGRVNAVQLLDKLKVPNSNQWAYVFIKEIEKK